jgi:hypothetical protein
MLSTDVNNCHLLHGCQAPVEGELYLLWRPFSDPGPSLRVHRYLHGCLCGGQVPVGPKVLAHHRLHSFCMDGPGLLRLRVQVHKACGPAEKPSSRDAGEGCHETQGARIREASGQEGLGGRDGGGERAPTRDIT